MSYLTERVSYLRGLAKGLRIDESKPEGELMMAIIDVLDDITAEVDELTESQNDILDMIEPEYSDEEDTCNGDCSVCDGCGDMDYFEVQCDNCGNTIYLDEDLLKSETEFECPVCKQKIEVDIDELKDGENN